MLNQPRLYLGRLLFRRIHSTHISVGVVIGREEMSISSTLRAVPGACHSGWTRHFLPAPKQPPECVVQQPAGRLFQESANVD